MNILLLTIKIINNTGPIYWYQFKRYFRISLPVPALLSPTHVDLPTHHRHSRAVPPLRQRRLLSPLVGAGIETLHFVCIFCGSMPATLNRTTESQNLNFCLIVFCDTSFSNHISIQNLNYELNYKMNA